MKMITARTTWDIAGSILDPFEPRQIRAARQRLATPALVRIDDLPGGHLTTRPHPTRRVDERSGAGGEDAE